MKFRTIMDSTLIVWDVPHLVSENYSDCQSIDIHFCLTTKTLVVCPFYVQHCNS